QAVPEPQSWVIMLMGFGVIGTALRYQPKKALRPIAG
ncbi:PEPxxWA-CTERM sorting domain-containing protein, partial [Sphingomonas sp. PsM26]|nr:PEPxxWA-CTERM sorting domain-containing protein [Sphingomonas sp. PsM26]